VNPFHFGTLTVLSNGSIYANVNTQRLGSLNGGSLHDVVYKEMYRGKSWRRIRKKVEPCKFCTFDALCPPLSNYEYALGRNNLCHIR
jgi:pseudo-rSAM protein